VFKPENLGEAQREIYRHFSEAKLGRTYKESSIRTPKRIPKYKGWECPKCGRINSSKTRICTRCGSEKGEK